MFKCQICGQSSHQLNPLITKVREVCYDSTLVTPSKEHFTRSRGREIVESLALCTSCYEKHRDTSPEVLSGPAPLRVHVEKRKRDVKKRKSL